MNTIHLEIRKRVLELHQQGLNNTQIAKAMGYKRVTSISYYIKELGLESNCKKNIPLKRELSDIEYNKLIDQIRKYAEQGYSKGETYKALNISKAQLNTCIKNENIAFHNLEDIEKSKLSLASFEEREKAFADKIKEFDNTKEYVSGFTNVDSRVTIKCLKCGCVYSINAQIVRHPNKHNIFCKNCYVIQKNQKDELKLKEQKEKELLKQQEEYKRATLKLLQSEQLGFSICEQCGNLIVGNRKFCSKSCRQKYYQKIKDINRRTNIKKNGNVDYTISLEKLIKRDNNICYLCNKECNLEDYTYQGNYFIAGNYVLFIKLSN